MKKILSIFVAVCMIAALCTVTAFAAVTGDGIHEETGIGELIGATAEGWTGGTGSADITFEVDGNFLSKYAVDITFSDTNFRYSTGATWDPNKHEYIIGNDGGVWSPASSTVTIDNHSDKAITYAAKFERKEDFDVDKYGDINLEFFGYEADTKVEIRGCPQSGEAPRATVTYGLTGKPNISQINAITLGTLTVTIAPVTPETGN